MSTTISLSDLRQGNCQVVSLLLAAAPAQRLKALGIFEGQQLLLAKRGNPLIVKAAGGRVAIARELAHQILVRVAGE